ncbi:DoxX family protein [Polyangium sp. y55x31]|uniref:DoxX family protein n=1 Tax=Polyangium sp. y55x31 TaxID=3042688 RepID=UPI002482A733|nr:DoxX family protein [Polyangium sp. y55x31]MDI1475128.1 DoxX family protein [Polyangium sp. y55x31]
MVTSVFASERPMEPVSTKTAWTGRILSGLAVAFLLFDVAIKLMAPPEVLSAHETLGFPPELARSLGTLLLACVVTYVIPRTSFLGAVLLTGYLGGAVATHVRVGNPLFSHVLFPVYVAAFIWGGLFLRDTRLRELFLPRR